jgi:hypothetical protein
MILACFHELIFLIDLNPVWQMPPSSQVPACSLGLSATSQQYFLSEQTSHQQPTSSTFLSEQVYTSHQPPAKRTGR